MNHPNTSDDLRRETEAKLLLFKQQLLYALPLTKESASKKSALREEVKELVDGMILINIPNELAWNLYIDWKDVASIGIHFSPKNVSAAIDLVYRGV